MDDFDAKELHRRMCGLAKSLAVAESLTCGHLQTIAGSTSGASEYFRGGVTAYDLERKVRLLGVDREHADQVDCVSERVAVEMARGACERFDADFAVSTTGYAEANASALVPYAYFAIWSRESGSAVICRRVEVSDLDRAGVQRRVAVVALGALLSHLRKGAERASR